MAALRPRATAVSMRFIEYMPLDLGTAAVARAGVSGAEIRAGSGALPVVAEAGERGSQTATRYRCRRRRAGGVGIIAPVTEPFCGACSRSASPPTGRYAPALSKVEPSHAATGLRSGRRARGGRGLRPLGRPAQRAPHLPQRTHFEQEPRRATMSRIGGLTLARPESELQGHEHKNESHHRRPLQS